jgi:DNA topoisomerase III
MLNIIELSSPELTGEWEHKLKLIEAGKLTREEFMAQIRDLVKNVVSTIKHGEIPEVVYATVPAPCPKCAGVVQENYRKVQCQKRDFSLWRVVSGREWAPEELAELFTKRFVGPLTGFRSKQGRPFSAGIRLSDELRLEFDFGQGANGESDEPVDFSGQEPLGACPKCSARVFEHGVAYVCEKAVGAGRTCDFRSGRMILQQPIEREQMKKLLETGRTELLTGFVSKKGRKFKAFLVKQPDGKIGFEFQPRAAKGEKPGEKPAEKPGPPEGKATRRGSERRAR